MRQVSSVILKKLQKKPANFVIIWTWKRKVNAIHGLFEKSVETSSVKRHKSVKIGASWTPFILDDFS